MRPQHRYTPYVWGAALGVHVLLFFGWQQAEQAREAVPIESTIAGSYASVELIAIATQGRAQAGTPIVALLGASDRKGSIVETAMRDQSDAPGDALGRASAGPKGLDAFADRNDKSVRSASPWNTHGANLMPHTGKSKQGASSPERIERSPIRGYSDAPRSSVQARLGAEAIVQGAKNNDGQGGTPGETGQEWLALDPRFDSAPSASLEANQGSVQLSLGEPLKERGELATEQPERGKVSESLQSSSRSNLPQPSVFHLGAPTSGEGSGTGSGGRRGHSSANHRGHGSAAQSGQGDASSLASTRASRSAPYFYDMYKRIDQELRFPAKMALALEQGDVLLSFQLKANGRVQGLRISKSSGFREFDAEALRAFLAASPFDEVPPTILQGRKHITVTAPYRFRNPLIR